MRRLHTAFGILGLLVPGAGQDLAMQLAPGYAGAGTVAYDEARGRLVAFAESLHLEPVTVHEWNGGVWTTQPTAPFGARREFAFTYDAARRRLVLFGGNRSDGPTPGLQSDTWEYVDGVWQIRLPSQSPPARAGHEMTYDAVRQRVVLFGGVAGAALQNDTWEWDGNTWQRIPTANAPAARLNPALAYDATQSRVVLFGGSAAGGVLNDHWTWDGTSWARVTSRTVPPGRSSAALAYDLTRQRLVLANGADHALQAIEDTWEFDGVDWSARPASRGVTSAAYSPHLGRLLALGGAGSAIQVWSGTTWVPIGVAAPDVPFRNGFATTTEVARAQVVLFGGEVPSRPSRRLNDTWIWNGQFWRELATSGPPPRSAAALAYDAVHSRSVLFGGVDGLNDLADTWLFDGSTWTAVTPAVSPGPRSGHAMAFDARSGRVVLFGGRQTVGNQYSDETWEWDGNVWTRAAVAVRPSARTEHGLAYDARRGRVVLFGGTSSAGDFADTWEWDGSSWTPFAGVPSPRVPLPHNLAFDRRSGECLLVGGVDGDAWTFDGVRWSTLALERGAVVANLAMVPDPRAERLFLPALPGHLLAPARTQDLGGGCGGARGVPRAVTRTRWAVGDPFAAVDLHRAPSNAPAALLLAGQTATVRIGVCILAVDPATALFLPLQTNAFGFGSADLPIPPVNALRGQSLWLHFVVSDATAALGFGVSDGLRAIVGG